MDAILETPYLPQTRSQNGRAPWTRSAGLRTGDIRLPQTQLHFAEAGDGPPLIMVPATISRLENWMPLARFMGQKFRTYFFELPGHGRSTPFRQPFHSNLVAETVESFADALGFERFSLMGFSFGGILAMRSLYHLQDRVERVILFAPAVSHRALPFSLLQRVCAENFVRLMRSPRAQTTFLELTRSGWTADVIGTLVRRLGNVEETISMDDVFRKIDRATIDVLAGQMGELLQFELPSRDRPFEQPCYFGMSVNDPMLDFETTLEVVEGQFENVRSVRFDYPWHQPKDNPTYESLNADYGQLLQEIC